MEDVKNSKTSFSQYEKDSFQNSLKEGDCDDHGEYDDIYRILKDIIDVYETKHGKKGLNFLEKLKEITLDELEEDTEFNRDIFDYYVILKLRDYTFADYFRFLISMNDDLFKHMENNKKYFTQEFHKIKNEEKIEEFEF